jgi:hypothetical protein
LGEFRSCGTLLQDFYYATVFFGCSGYSGYSGLTFPELPELPELPDHIVFLM